MQNKDTQYDVDLYAFLEHNHQDQQIFFFKKKNEKNEI